MCFYRNGLRKLTFVLNQLLVGHYNIKLNYCLHAHNYALFSDEKGFRLKINLLNKAYYLSHDRTFITKNVTLRYDKKKNFVCNRSEM